MDFIIMILMFYFLGNNFFFFFFFFFFRNSADGHVFHSLYHSDNNVLCNFILLNVLHTTSNVYLKFGANNYDRPKILICL